MNQLRSVISRVPRGYLYSTQSLSAIFSSKSGDSLRRRVVEAGDPDASIIPVLREWLREGKKVAPDKLQLLVKHLRQNGRLKHALEISEWGMGELNHDTSPGDTAIRLELISKVHGQEEAEKYFNSIPESMRSLQLYNALVNSYAENKCLEKAEGILQKMKELGIGKSTLSRNVMLQLYARLGKLDEVDTLLQDLEEKGIECHKLSFHARLNACASAYDVEGMERILTEMTTTSCAKVDWNCIGAGAKAGLRAGLNEATLQMLNTAEKLITDETRRTACETLLPAYAVCGRKDDVYRLWDSCKEMRKHYNSCYIVMINSLIKLDDVDGAEKIYKEWESGCTKFDSKVPNLMASAFCKKDLLGKAEDLIKKLETDGKMPAAITWSALAGAYHRSNKMEEAVVALKKAIVASTPQWRPRICTLTACVDYLESQGDGDALAELLDLLKERGLRPQVTDILNRNGENDID